MLANAAQGPAQTLSPAVHDARCDQTVQGGQVRGRKPDHHESEIFRRLIACGGRPPAVGDPVGKAMRAGRPAWLSGWNSTHPMTPGSSSRSTPSAASLAVRNAWRVFGSGFLPSDRPGQSKKTASRPVPARPQDRRRADNVGRAWRAVEYRRRAQTAVDGPGRCAYSYGSDGRRATCVPEPAGNCGRRRSPSGSQDDL